MATPALPYFLLEPLRGVVSLAALPLAAPALGRAPRGDGHGVLVLPGLLADDFTTRPIRRFLGKLGYETRGWGLGRNVGPTAAVVEGIPQALDALRESTGSKVSIIGWSLGGIFARELARNRPDDVRQVITLASPYAMKDGETSRADAAFRRHARSHAPGLTESRTAMRQPIPVPSTSVYSKTDGIVDWRSCREAEGPGRENVAVLASHLGIGHDASVLWLIADRLAQPEGLWQPFRRPPGFGALYPR